MPSRLLTWLALACAALLLVAPAPAAAQTCSATITDIDFGDPDLISGSADDALATLTVTCTRIPILSVVKICPSIGEGSGGSSGSTRLLRSSGGTLAYQLYSDASRTQGWGALDQPDLGTVPAILLGGGLATSGTATRTIYGRVFGAQTTAPTGNYESVFMGSATAFTYGAYLLGVSSSCTGFVGTAVVRPAFTVLASAQPNCTISASDLGFGTAGVLSTAINAQGSLTVTCTRATPYAVTLDGGISAAPPTARRMTAASGDFVTYGLFRDSARTQPWGADSTTRVSGTGTGSSATLPVYGRIPAQTTPRPGSYSDRIVATVTF